MIMRQITQYSDLDVNLVFARMMKYKSGEPLNEIEILMEALTTDSHKQLKIGHPGSSSSMSSMKFRPLQMPCL